MFKAFICKNIVPSTIRKIKALEAHACVLFLSIVNIMQLSTCSLWLQFVRVYPQSNRQISMILTGSVCLHSKITQQNSFFVLLITKTLTVYSRSQNNVNIVYCNYKETHSSYNVIAERYV